MRRLAVVAMIALGVLAMLYAATRAQETRQEAVDLLEDLRAKDERLEGAARVEEAKRVRQAAEEVLEQLQPRETDVERSPCMDNSSYGSRKTIAEDHGCHCMLCRGRPQVST